MLRRFSLAKRPPPTFVELFEKAHGLFKIPETEELTLTYMDREGDIVTMMSDSDVKEAITIQALNPLRLTFLNEDMILKNKILTSMDMEDPDEECLGECLMTLSFEEVNL